MSGEPGSCSVKTLSELLEIMLPRGDMAGLELVSRAYRVAEAAHASQKRSTGEPYITHPLAVAGILACHKLDAPTIAAALLHDIVEDTPVSLDDIREQFGDEIANMVDAVTKLSQREGIKKEFEAQPAAAGVNSANRPAAEIASETMQYRTNREAESIRKMMLGMVNDVRAVLIKLADRLHNMRTLDALSPERQRKIARETLEIYAPLANRLGIWEWKQQLEDLGFRYAEPEVYASISQKLEAGAHEREAAVAGFIEKLRQALAEAGIENVQITGRVKQIYSIWRKMQSKNRSFDQISDLHAIRVIIEDGSDAEDEAHAQADSTALHARVNGTQPAEAQLPTLTDLSRSRPPSERFTDPAVQMCYVVLGVVHRLWRPIPGEFDDYIAMPKDNHYQSLHTAVIADDGKTLEVQIRTRSMHKAAEFGVAAHWLYKESAMLNEDYQRRLETLREAIRSISTAEEDATSFVDALKADHFKDTVFCFTPKGKLIELPAGSTVLDFAYRIHTDIGNHCRGARVNGVFEPLTYKLKNGDQVEVITRPNATPSRDWLEGDDYVVTANARTKIRQWFRKQDREQNIAAGRERIEREMKRLAVSSWMTLDDVYELFKVDKSQKDKVDDFLEKVGYGQISLASVSARILEEERRRESERQGRLNGFVAPLLRPTPAPAKGGWCITGVHGIYGVPAPCCNPLPGDPVIGYVTRGQGVKVHHRDCKNIANAEPERLISVSYEGKPQDAYPVQFLVTAVERQGLLHDLTGVLASMHVNIIDCRVVRRDLKLGEATVWLKVELSHTDSVAPILNRLGQVRNVFEVKRVLNARQK
ncbi:MAG: bifunctional (p)ppGpp synthetase/guanosine-3',5'-bis(diphosphate) 3'-pyrophosphohydrolase [Anaerolineae bacterium]|nr:bifunctional (p)ppGpp synthetase/guanosine-3',5'-bis(diphosphate) 3'-pyrophosphohydrolase [Thermoflexales bacterium]MDW8407883.1 bifunctional (p)ppGpp synthetase/guanosine-3',5'-bis(diphosphate) 3'-pyrophosphohydrolase [Anaerolineae bacterium]